MTPERTARVVARWVRFYTRDLPAPVAQRRIDEIDADLHDHVAHERAAGTAERRIALGIASRMIRGLAADAAWRGREARRAAQPSPEDTMKTNKTLYCSSGSCSSSAPLPSACGVRSTAGKATVSGLDACGSME